MIVLHPAFHPSFVQFLKEFNVSHDYFECHELLEDYWKEVAPRQKQHALTALILLSTAMYHWRRRNLVGAIKTMKTSINRLNETSNSIIFDKINIEKLKLNMRISFELMQQLKEFQSFSIDIISADLLDQVNELQLPEMENLHFLTHKHMLRDRTDILEEREKQKKRRDDLV